MILRQSHRSGVDDSVDNAEILGHLRCQKRITLQRVLDLLERLTGVPHVDFIEPLLEVQDLLGVKHDVGRLALEAAGGLVDHDSGIGERKAQVLGPRREQQRAHRSRLPDA